ncbi:MAG TPA: hypothetical protein VLK29_00960 [Luteimonas sp.]|nr:hypothetical protein [Luteimonas sp.]
MNVQSTPKRLKDYLPWVIAAVAVLALAATLLWKRDAGTDGTVRQLTERLDAIESGRALDAQGRPAARPGGGRGAVMADDGGLSSIQQKSPEQAEAERSRQLKELEAAFSRDAADPVGGPRTETTLVQTISGSTMAGTGLKPNDVDIACKQNSCRIVGTFDRMGDAQDWSLFYITAAGGNVLSQTQMVFVPAAGGKTEVRIYSTRAKG